MLWYGYYVISLRISATDKQMVVQEDQSLVVDIIPKGSMDDLRVEILEQPKWGLLSVKERQYLYNPAENYFGEDYFTYRLSLGNRVSDSATIRITITAENDAPIARDTHISLSEDNSVEFNLEAEDVDNDKLVYIISRYPKNGSIDGIPPHLTYTPFKNQNGPDQLQYSVYDGKARSLPAVVKIDVIPSNDPPEAVNKLITTYRKTPIEFKLEGTDIEKDILSYEIIEQPLNGVIRKKTDKYIYTPMSYFTGSDQLAFVVTDGIEYSKPGIIKIDVKPINMNKQLGYVLDGVVEEGGVAIGEYDKPEYLFHPGKYIPASVLKIITAAAALHSLGENYRFKTEVSISKSNELVIKGFGDPTLSSRDWHDIALNLKKMGLFDSDFKKLIINTSVFSDTLIVDGRRSTLNYFDAPPSTLASNENTVVITIKRGRKIIVNDEYTPLTAMLVNKARRLPNGVQRFNVALNSQESVEYSMELAQAIFEQYGAFFEEEAEIKRNEQGLKPVYVHESKSTVPEVVKEMLQQSNNFIANQLLLNIAYLKIGEGASIDDGVKIVSEFLREEIDIDQHDFKIVEGSGLSTQNNINLLSMLKVMNYFTEFKQLLPLLSSSKYSELAKAGRKWKILAKSGTLKNVSTLAGFILVKNREWKPFVIMLNDDGMQRGEVMEIIGQYYNG